MRLSKHWTKQELDAISDAVYLLQLADRDDEEGVRAYLVGQSPERLEELCVALASLGVGLAGTYAKRADLSFSEAMESLLLGITDTAPRS